MSFVKSLTAQKANQEIKIISILRLRKNTKTKSYTNQTTSHLTKDPIKLQHHTENHQANKVKQGLCSYLLK